MGLRRGSEHQGSEEQRNRQGTAEGTGEGSTDRQGYKLQSTGQAGLGVTLWAFPCSLS